ncbi:hypothetical protein BO71DRAFT_484941 [Aspergillus ellipticus CBS 707.79]|uniref:Uncharacterized protein n=1 Tax=Aspergillus ellipticus CBS 707.79 TaxID=1448320 RepID=A0A319D785_9EURO|nr:hypothetical protein BO71DRAFT_484941 [Aspergillus ellipticus CBS 707.79]
MLFKNLALLFSAGALALAAPTPKYTDRIRQKSIDESKALSAHDDDVLGYVVVLEYANHINGAESLATRDVDTDVKFYVTAYAKSIGDAKSLATRDDNVLGYVIVNDYAKGIEESQSLKARDGETLGYFVSGYAKSINEAKEA